MKNTAPKRLQFATASKRRPAFDYAFNRKSAIIRNIEIIIACLIAFIAGSGLYEVFK